MMISTDERQSDNAYYTSDYEFVEKILTPDMSTGSLDYVLTFNNRVPYIGGLTSRIAEPYDYSLQKHGQGLSQLAYSTTTKSEWEQMHADFFSNLQFIRVFYDRAVGIQNIEFTATYPIDQQNSLSGEEQKIKLHSITGNQPLIDSYIVKNGYSLVGFNTVRDQTTGIIREVEPIFIDSRDQRCQSLVNQDEVAFNITKAFIALDSNSDSYLSSDEMKTAEEKFKAPIIADSDNSLTPTEFQAYIM